MVVADEYLRKYAGKQCCRGGKHHAAAEREGDALAEQIVELLLVARAVVEGNDRRSADRVSDEYRDKYELDVHQYAVCRNAVPAQIFQQPEVVDHADNGGADVAHQLGAAVGARLQYGAQLKTGAGELQQAVVFAQEVYKGYQPADTLAQPRGDSRPGDAPAERADKERIQHHIRNACGNGDGKAHFGLFGGDKEALEYVLEHEGDGEPRDNPAVKHAVIQHFGRCAEKFRHRAHEYHAERGKHGAQYKREVYYHGKQLFGAFAFAFAQRFGNKRSAARADHEAHPAQHHYERHDKVHRGKRRLPHKVGNEKTVHDAVDRGEYHHADRGQYKAYQPFVCEMIGYPNVVFCHCKSLSAARFSKK